MLGTTRVCDDQNIRDLDSWVMVITGKLFAWRLLIKYVLFSGFTLLVIFQLRGMFVFVPPPPRKKRKESKRETRMGYMTHHMNNDFIRTLYMYTEAHRHTGDSGPVTGMAV